MNPQATDNVLEVNNIEVIYHKTVQALRGLSLAVPRGQIVALLGSNGAGKSTTLKAVSGLLALENGELASGSVHFNGRSTAGRAPQELVRGGLSHVMEGRRVFEDLTIEENLVASTYALSGRAGAARPDFARAWRATCRAASSRCWPSAARSSRSPSSSCWTSPRWACRRS
jgi:branched-chain amino acid transport system ATP-binding protein